MGREETPPKNLHPDIHASPPSTKKPPRCSRPQSLISLRAKIIMLRGTPPNRPSTPSPHTPPSPHQMASQRPHLRPRTPRNLPAGDGFHKGVYSYLPSHTSQVACVLPLLRMWDCTAFSSCGHSRKLGTPL